MKWPQLQSNGILVYQADEQWHNNAEDCADLRHGRWTAGVNKGV